MHHLDWPSGIQREPASLGAQREKMHHLVFIEDLVANTITVIRRSHSSLHTEGKTGE